MCQVRCQQFSPLNYKNNQNTDFILSILHVTDPVSADENKVLHTVQTIGQLSTKTAHRVYHSVVAQLKTIKKEDVAQYMSSVVSILHLTQFLASGQEQTEQKTNSPTQEKK